MIRDKIFGIVTICPPLETYQLNTVVFEAVMVKKVNSIRMYIGAAIF